MKFSKKYIAAGSAVIVSLSLCAYALNQHRSQENKDNNRVSYVDGSQSSQKSENLTPDQVSQKEGIQAEQIVIKITDQGYVTSHGDHYHYYNGKVPYDALFSEELLMKDPNYKWSCDSAWRPLPLYSLQQAFCLRRKDCQNGAYQWNWFYSFYKCKT